MFVSRPFLSIAGGNRIPRRLYRLSKSNRDLALRRGMEGNAKERKAIMTRGTIVSLVAAVLVGIASIATISTDAFAYRAGRVGVGRAGVYHGGVYRGGVYRGGVYRGAVVRPGVAVGVGAAAAGAAAAGAYGAYGRPRCGYYPYPPC